MTDLATWSRSATGNKDTSPAGAQEGWVGSDVGPWAREAMAAVARFYQNALWVSKINDINPENTPKSVTKGLTDTQVRIGSFTSDPSAYFPAGRFMRLVSTSDSITPGFVNATSYLGGTLTITLDCLANSKDDTATIPDETYEPDGVQFCILSEDGNVEVGGKSSYASYTGHQTIGPGILSGGGTEAVRDAKFPVVPPVDGVLWWNTTKPTGSSSQLQASEAGSWVPVHDHNDGVINILSFGAVGSEGTDDQAAIQAAIDAADAAGGVVLVPEGTFWIGSQITVPGDLRLVGLGRVRSTIKAMPGFNFSTSKAVIQLGDPGSGSVSASHACTIEHLRIHANDVANSICVYSDTVNELGGVFNCLLHSFKSKGIHVEKANGGTPQNFNLRNLEFYISSDSEPNAATAIDIDSDGQRFLISNVSVVAYSSSLNTGGIGIKVDGMNGLIQDCHFEQVTDGIRLAGAGGVTVINADGHGTGDANAVENVVYIEDLAANNNTVLLNITTRGATNAVNDQVHGYILDAGAGNRSVAMYVVGIGTDPSVLTTWPTIPSSLSQIWSNGTAIADFTNATCVTTLDPTVTMDSTALLSVGMAVSGTGIPERATVASIDSGGTTFELSADATIASDPVTLTFSHYAPSSGWGTVIAVNPNAANTSMRGRVGISTGVAGVSLSANPSIEVSFTDVDFPSSDAFVQVSRGDTSVTAGYWAVTSRGSTSFTATFVGTPSVSQVYVLDWMAMG